MNKKASIIDCGSGNFLSVIRALKYIGVDVNIINSPKDIKSSERLIFPGVGTYSNVMSYINKNELFSSISDFCFSGKPFLGICLGMQILFEESEEFGNHKGFGLLKGKVIKIKGCASKKIRIPHTNWNSLLINNCINSKFKKSLSNNLQMYFTHSYMAVPKKQEDILAYTIYNDIKITALVQKENLIGCQFHPERSGKDGLNFLKCFMEI